jgi:hypothetical protein
MKKAKTSRMNVKKPKSKKITKEMALVSYAAFVRNNQHILDKLAKL